MTKAFTFDGSLKNSAGQYLDQRLYSTNLACTLRPLCWETGVQ